MTRNAPITLDAALDSITENCADLIITAAQANRRGLQPDLLLEQANRVQESVNDLFRIIHDLQPTSPEGGFRAALGVRGQSPIAQARMSLEGLLKRGEHIDGARPIIRSEEKQESTAEALRRLFQGKRRHG